MTTSTPISSADHVADIAARSPLTTRVFKRHDIGFCCGGNIPVSEACAERGVDVDVVMAQLQEVVDAPASREAAVWTDAPLGELTAHIVTTYHEPLHEELPRLEEMMAKVLRVHGDKDPERLPELQKTLAAVRVELMTHMPKEEQVLFPMIERGEGAQGSAPINVMEHEHDEIATLLRRMRELTDDYTPPAEACMTWKGLWAGLESLERETQEHIHLENNILFPRALATA
jgi:regulator of cell morphogenesis and NO signaling